MILQRRFWGYVLLSLVFLVTSCARTGGAPSPTPVLTPTFTPFTYVVQRGKVTQTLELTGIVVPVEEVSLYFQISGYVDQVYVQPGQQVKDGDVLAELGGDTLRYQIASAELDLALAQARLNQAEIDNAYAIAQAKIALDLAREELTRTLQLPERYVAEADVRRAEIELEYRQKGVNSTLSIEMQKAQLALDWLTETSRIIAPQEGVIVSLALYPGRSVEPFEPVVVIADSSHIEISVEFTPQQPSSVTIGKEVELALSTQPERTWTGIISRLPSPYGANGTTGNVASDNNAIRIRLEGDVSELKFGDRMSVTVPLEEKDNVLWLPSNLIQTTQGRTFVTVLKDGRQQRVDVVLGLAGQERVEILQGLDEGEAVVSP